ncbi:MAG: hypothetical protein R3F20_05570 [Planctomycetota bacterium]
MLVAGGALRRPASRCRNAGSTSSSPTIFPRVRALSSSAALPRDAGGARGRRPHPPHRDAAILARDAEEAALGTPCGLLDQLAIRGAKPGRAALVDCGSGARREIPLPPDLAILVVDSGEERHLAATGYADRVTECRTAAELLARRAGRPGLRLGAAEPDLLAHFGESPEEATLLRRARHVIGETARVREAAAALEAEDLEALGRLVRASHASLAGDFEVSTPRLDAIVAHATRHAGCLGARLLGAGFGGSVLVLGRVGRLAGLREHLEAIAPRQAQILVAPVGAA